MSPSETHTDALSLVDANVLNYYEFKPGATPQIVSPKLFLTPKRLDVMARYVFAKHFELGLGLEWGMFVYRNLLESWNPAFIDGDGRKVCFTDYLTQFSQVLRNIKAEGFQRHYNGAIPYTGDTIVDGAHRLGACLYYDTPIEVIEMIGDPQVQDAQTLLRIGMNEQAVEHLVHEYIKLDKNTYAVNLFPESESSLQRVMEVLNRRSTVVHQKSILLTDTGKRNLIRLLYGHEPWWKEYQLKEFVDLRFPQKVGVRSDRFYLVFITIPETEDIRDIKEEVRSHFNVGPHPAHINDTHRETVWIAESCLNKNSLHFLNHAVQKHYAQLDRLLKDYRALIQDSGCPDNFCVDSSTVLSMYGLRQARDIDYLSADRSLLPYPDDELIGNHNFEYPQFPIRVDEMVYNPNFHFMHRGVKFQSLDMVYLFKKLRGSRKDYADMKLMVRVHKQKLPTYEKLPGPPWYDRDNLIRAWKKFKHRPLGFIYKRKKKNNTA